MDIRKFIKSGEEPFPDTNYGDGYRCSAYLKDGTFLPCVIIRKNQKYIELACRRIKEEMKGKSIFANKKEGYREIIKTFVTSGNIVNDYDIESVEKSNFAIPLSLLSKIEGETVMSWTGFVFEMHDGMLFSYDTTFQVEFFDLVWRYGDAFKVQLDIGGKVPQVIFHFARDVHTAGIVVAEVVEETRLVLVLHRFGRRMQIGQRRVTACDHQRHVPGFSNVVQNTRQRLFLQPDFDVNVLAVP